MSKSDLDGLFQGVKRSTSLQTFIVAGLLFGFCGFLSAQSLVFSFVLLKDPLIRDASSFVDILRANTTLTELRNYRLYTLFLFFFSTMTSFSPCEHQIAICHFHQHLDQANRLFTTLWRN